MFSSRMNFADQADWCDSGVLAAKQRLAASGRLPWVAGQDTCPTGYSQGGIASRGEYGPLGYPRLGGAYGRQNVGGFNIQNLLQQQQQQQQQQLFDDLECSTGGYNHPLLANHPLLNSAVNRFQAGMLGGPLGYPRLGQRLGGSAAQRLAASAHICPYGFTPEQAHLIHELMRTPAMRSLSGTTACPYGFSPEQSRLIQALGWGGRMGKERDVAGVLGMGGMPRGGAGRLEMMGADQGMGRMAMMMRGGEIGMGVRRGRSMGMMEDAECLDAMKSMGMGMGMGMNGLDVAMGCIVGDESGVRDVVGCRLTM
ncbi:hypothetical protein HDU98_000790 [Podochytrium sp. JEL0797]|nr:hypothetical protein HDU98_000790 [Podochytrium sp. JEL0797]